MRQTKTKPGRPREFNQEEATRKALNLFWRQGYASTSLDDLCREMDLNRPSLYAAYGDKRGVFLQTIDVYKQKARLFIESQWTDSGSLKKDLERAYLAIVEIYLSPKGGYGCFLISVAATEAVEDEDIRKSISSGLAEVDDCFRKRFQRAFTEGELSKKSQIESKTKIAVAFLHSLASRARGGESKKSLHDLVQLALLAVLEGTK